MFDNLLIYLTVFVVVLVQVILSFQFSFPEGVEKYEGIFLGEGMICGGTSAKVVTYPQTVRVSNETIISVIGTAIADAVSEVEGDPSQSGVYSAAQESSQKILEVVSEAVAEVSVEINSPNAGCWAIGYGRAEAVAIAEVAITAVAQALAKASEDTQVYVESESVVNDVQTEMKEVVLRLVDGWGNGFRSQNKKVTASAKAQAVNCALARAFASIVEQKTQAIVQVQSGCVEVPFSRAAENYIGCQCIWKNNYGAPNLCGQFGDLENGDYICYTSQECFCSMKSERYPELKWRYCGPTFDTMKKWLNVYNSKNDMEPLPGGNGYCGDFQSGDTLAPLPGEPPAPTPSPIYTAATPIVVELPPFIPELTQPEIIMPTEICLFDENGNRKC